MHKFALFFMLAMTASMIAVLSEPIFAQEMTGDVTSDDNSTSDAAPEDSETGEQTANEDSSDEEMSEETTADSTSMEMTTMASHIDSPLKQMSMGIDPHQIQCDTGYKLVFKASNWNPACVKESSFQTLSSWGWIANHDPTQDELTKMMEDHMAKYPPVTEQEHQTDMKESMDVEDDSSSTNSTGADQPVPQSHTVELSESMDMGAQ